MECIKPANVAPITGYGYGCRCPRCSRAKMAASRAWRLGQLRTNKEAFNARASARQRALRHRDDPTEGIKCCLCPELGLFLDDDKAIAHLRTHEGTAA